MINKKSRRQQSAGLKVKTIIIFLATLIGSSALVAQLSASLWSHQVANERDKSVQFSSYCIVNLQRFVPASPPPPPPPASPRLLPLPLNLSQSAIAAPPLSSTINFSSTALDALLLSLLSLLSLSSSFLSLSLFLPNVNPHPISFFNTKERTEIRSER